MALSSENNERGSGFGFGSSFEKLKMGGYSGAIMEFLLCVGNPDP